MLDVQFIGPSLDAGAYPTVFYFALSAHDSLFLDPFNQPAVILQAANMRIFSVTLPGHDLLPPTQALQYWSEKLRRGENPIDPFIDEVADYIQKLFSQRLITSCGVMGLSRGVFIAAHVAAKLDFIQSILGFAPLTKLESVVEFEGLNVHQWDLNTLSQKLYSKKIRCYIGNHDTRVGTSHCFFWLYHLAQVAYEKRIRTSPIELRMIPSIGRDGHGTPPEIFREGAEWLLKQLRDRRVS